MKGKVEGDGEGMMDLRWREVEGAGRGGGKEVEEESGRGKWNDMEEGKREGT